MIAAIATTRQFARSRRYPFPPGQAFEFTIAAPLPELFSHWYGPLPPVVSVDGPEEWGAAGLVRTVRTADGSTMHEEMLDVERPRQFSYRLSQLTGALRHLAASVDGAWHFEPVDGGTQITWSWVVHPASGFAAVILPVVGRCWQGYARRALDQLEQLMVARQG